MTTRSGSSAAQRRGLAAVLLAVLVAGGVVLATVAGSQRAGRQRAFGNDGRSLVSVPVRTPDGRVESLPVSGGGVILVVSRSCVHCHAVIRSMAQEAGGRPLPRLVLLALEGAEPARAMSDSARLGARPRGPAAGIRALLDGLQIRATPVLIRTDARGRVVETLGGEISRGEATRWTAWAR